MPAAEVVLVSVRLIQRTCRVRATFTKQRDVPAASVASRVLSQMPVKAGMHSGRVCTYTHQSPLKQQQARASAIIMDLKLDDVSAYKVYWAVQQQKPLIQCITNFVSMDFMANTLLAIGASPAMAHSYDEVEAFQQIATGLVINVGTLTPDWVASMDLAARTASKLGKPWVLDPVGAGATPFRTQTILTLLKLKPTLIRGNASEIMAVAGASGAATRGVDSTASPSDALESGKQLAKKYDCIVGISGAEDLVTDGEQVIKVSNGLPMMTKITAAGCSVTAMACAFITVAPKQPLLATAFALAMFGLSAEWADNEAKGPSSLRVGMLDHLYDMEHVDLEGRGLRFADVST